MAEVVEKTDSRLVLRSVIQASCAEVFAAWTDPDSLRHWMCPGRIVRAEAQVDLRVGGAFRILMRGPDQDFDHHGEYLVIDPPTKLVFTWISEGTGRQATRVTVDLAARGDKCELLLTHEELPTAEALERHAGGWGQILDRFSDHMAWRSNADLRMVLRYDSPLSKLYEQFATQQGVRNWWVATAEMESRLGGAFTARFPKSDFHAVFRITRLDPDRAVEWECLESRHPEKLGFRDREDWVGTKLRFEVQPLDDRRSQLTFTHAGLAPLECFGVCSNLWSFFLGQSLREYLATGTGRPSTGT
jgi:uncharacterized protein YndB with AHSA1/START domain